MKVIILLLSVLGLACAQQCLPDEFVCDNGNCVPDRWICDGDDDCRDGSDERNCTVPSTTPCSGFTCPSGRCISAGWECDGDNDCGDWADERNCPDCRSFECPGSRICLPDRFLCDGTDDCGDGSDETEEACPCDEGELRCAKPPGSNVPGPCIPPEWVCDADGIWDCPDGSDEDNCTMTHPKAVPRYREATIRANSLKRLMKLAEQQERKGKKV